MPTTTEGWPDEFEVLLRQSLPLMPDDRPLQPDDELVAYGLDSLGIVSLLIDLEDQFDIIFPDDDVNPDTFSTANTLWSATLELRSATSKPD